MSETRLLRVIVKWHGPPSFTTNLVVKKRERQHTAKPSVAWRRSDREVVAACRRTVVQSFEYALYNMLTWCVTCPYFEPDSANSDGRISKTGRTPLHATLRQRRSDGGINLVAAINSIWFMRCTCMRLSLHNQTARQTTRECSRNGCLR